MGISGQLAKWANFVKSVQTALYAVHCLYGFGVCQVNIEGGRL